MFRPYITGSRIGAKFPRVRPATEAHDEVRARVYLGRSFKNEAASGACPSR